MKKKDEFGQMRSTDDFWHYKKAIITRGARFVLHYLYSPHHLAFSREGDSWLLSRLVPGSAHQAREAPRSGTSLITT